MNKKEEILTRIDSVCKALDSMSVVGVQNAGNLAGCYSILQDVANILNRCTVADSSTLETDAVPADVTG